MQTWLLARLLSARGKSQRHIARELEVDRKTVRRALEGSATGPRCERGAPATASLAPYRRTVEERLRRGVGGDRILAELQASGYTGSRSTFYRWLRWLQEELGAVAPAFRFETGPAEQCQFDWSPYALRIGGVVTPVIVYAVVLCCSRRIHWHVSLSQKLDAVLDGLEASLRHFGGACRCVVVDNARSMVLMHRRSQVRFNDAFLAFCVHYRICPIAATPGHPQGKGKVENPFGVLESARLRGGEWRDLDHLIADMAEYEAQREQKVHGTTAAAPAIRFLQEAPLLTPLPDRVFLGAGSFVRRVNNDATISFGGVRYFIPSAALTHHVRVRTERGRELCVYNSHGALVFRHAIEPPGSPLVIPTEALEARRIRQRTNLEGAMLRFRQRYGCHGDVVEGFLRGMLRLHAHHPERAICTALDLLRGAPDAVAVATIGDAVELGLCSNDALQTILARRMRQSPRAEIPVPAISPLLPACDVDRALDTYGRALPPRADAPKPGAQGAKGDGRHVP